MRSRVRSWAATILVLMLVAGVLGLVGLRLRGHALLERTAARYRADGFPVEPAGFERLNVPVGENAALEFRDGAEHLVLDAGEATLIGHLANRPSGSWSARERARVEAVLVANEQALAHLLKAGVLDDSSFEIEYRLGWSARVPDLIRLVQSSRLLAVKARHDLLRGRYEGAVEACASLGALAESLRRESMLTFQTVSTQPEMVLASVAEEILASPSVTAAGAEALEAVLPGLTATETLPRALVFEGVSQARFLEGRRRDESGQEPFVYRVAVALFGEYLAARTLEGHLEAARALDGPYPGIARELDRMAPEDASYLRQLLSGAPPWLGGVYGRMAAATTETQLARLACRIRAAGLREGGYPVDLLAVPGAGVVLPLTGRPASYERRADGSAALRAPGARETWRQTLQGVEDLGAFRFELPPP